MTTPRIEIHRFDMAMFYWEMVVVGRNCDRFRAPFGVTRKLEYNRLASDVLFFIVRIIFVGLCKKIQISRQSYSARRRRIFHCIACHQISKFRPLRIPELFAYKRHSSQRNRSFLSVFLNVSLFDALPPGSIRPENSSGVRIVEPPVRQALNCIVVLLFGHQKKLI